MDLNYLLERHQTSLLRVRGASCAPSRRAHEGLADGYALRINALYEKAGAVASCLPQVAS